MAMKHLGALLALSVATAAGWAQPSPAPAAAASAPAVPALRWFAIELRTGPRWDAAKPPQEQAGFREHSAHLRTLRQQGHIAMGARYGEVGLIVVRAANAVEAKALFDADPTVQQQVFAITVQEMGVFYPGWVGPERRP
jgi:uncharacterized protein YciI